MVHDIYVKISSINVMLKLTFTAIISIIFYIDCHISNRENVINRVIDAVTSMYQFTVL